MSWGDALPYPYHSYRKKFVKLVWRKATSNDFSVCPFYPYVCMSEYRFPGDDTQTVYLYMYMNIESTLCWPSVSIWIFYGISYFCSLTLSLNLPPKHTLNLIFLSIYLSICLSVAYFPTFSDLSHSLPLFFFWARLLWQMVQYPPESEDNRDTNDRRCATWKVIAGRAAITLHFSFFKYFSSIDDIWKDRLKIIWARPYICINWHI